MASLRSCILLLLMFWPDPIYVRGRKCHPTEFQCDVTKKCIDRFLVMNGRMNCGGNDTSDEDKPLARCHPRTEFRCRGNGQCVDRKYINNKGAISICHDKSDGGFVSDFHCDDNNEYKCGSGNCVKRHLVWKGLKTCSPQDDDQESAGECDQETEFKCQKSGVCIKISQVWNKERDCPDGEDEETEMGKCLETEFRCSDGSCIPRHKVGDGLKDCGGEGEDEKPGALNVCILSLEHPCYDEDERRTVTRCIPRCWVNDGIAHCADGSDETVTSLHCYDDEWSCDQKKKCLRSQQLCDGIVDCMDCSDEINTEHCSKEQRSRFFQCTNPTSLGDVMRDSGIVTSHCILRGYFCDGIVDCQDGSDEAEIGSGFKCRISKSKPGSSSTRTCVLPQLMIDDAITDCDDGSDEPMAGLLITGSYYTCLDSNNVNIKVSQFCDGVFDCFDLSDECLCEIHNDNYDVTKVCQNICFRKTSTNTVTIEMNSLDPCDVCPQANMLCDVSATSYKCLPLQNICDGIRDCDDKLDELFCSAKHNVTSYKTSNTSFLCPLSDDLKYFQQAFDEIPTFATRCDGKAQCFGLADECDDVTIEENTTVCSHVIKMPDFCEHLAGLYSCPDDETVPLWPHQVCDGRIDCNDEADEMYCDDTRFKCEILTTEVYSTTPSNGKLISIDKKRLCDGHVDCFDRMDERNCSHYFYCKDELPPYFVEKDYVMDGKRDCSDGSDECPHPDLFADDPLSSRDQLITHPWLRAWVWIMALVAIVGNLLVIITTLEKIVTSQFHLPPMFQLSNLFSPNNRRDRKKALASSPLMRCNDILVVNLALADLLTGVYLLLIAVKSVQFSGSYCIHEMAWRSSAQCENLGALIVTATQASVGIMVALTAFRLYAVIRPWGVKALKTTTVLFLTLIIWVVSIMLGLTPFLTSLRDAFVTSSFTGRSQGTGATLYFATEVVNKTSMTSFLRKVCALSRSQEEICTKFSSIGATWTDLNDGLTALFDKLTIKGYFGYYSSHGVCLPALYPLEHDVTTHTSSRFPATARYTALLVTMNSVAFLLVAAAYSLICYESTTKILSHRKSLKIRRSSRGSVRVSDMHKRIGKLVLTDFLCHMPVCVLSICGLLYVPIPAWVYSFTAVVLLPINSALNPILYSGVVTSAAGRIKRLITKRGKEEEQCERINIGATSTETTKSFLQNRHNVVNRDRSSASKPLTSVLNQNNERAPTSGSINKLLKGKRKVSNPQVTEIEDFRQKTQTTLISTPDLKVTTIV
ncbi:uncharacterized protein LOC143449962 [Clavelina lepadiformis]|uniref:uncharacterized protein LOC143449962 n=1 Tax=Clavelina lepadiformis TaxID=159417 RepID=UPI0040415F46